MHAFVFLGVYVLSFQMIYRRITVYLFQFIFLVYFAHSLNKENEVKISLVYHQNYREIFLLPPNDDDEFNHIINQSTSEVISAPF